ncbi:MAG: DUF4919 domain-containing protein [candidate division Zixibacteria bacterium]|nr:DUF4919 domain-containing protein [candidate division Zixibacteria bacterium]
MWFKKRRNHKYYSMLDKVLNGNMDIDFTEFRMLYTETPDYNPYDNEKFAQMTNAYQCKDYTKAIEIANRILKDNYPNIQAHRIGELAHYRINDMIKYSYHGKLAHKLLESINKSGDGRTTESAFKVISTAEEYAYMECWPMKVKKQHLIQANNKYFDKLEVFFSELAGVNDLYFDISVPYRWLNERIKD